MSYFQNPIEDKNVLIVDGDRIFCELLKGELKRQRVQSIVAHDGETGLKMLYAHRPDLVIMANPILGMDSSEFIRTIRLVSDMPIIMLAGPCKDRDIVEGLDHGADYFIAKPFSNELLIARINALLRRCANIAQPSSQPYDDGYVRISPDENDVSIRGQRLKLTATERRLLTLLYKNANKRLSHDTILSTIWGRDSNRSLSYVHVYMSRLRNKIEQDPKNPVYLLTEYGYGYRFRKVNQHAH